MTVASWAALPGTTWGQASAVLFVVAFIALLHSFPSLKLPLALLAASQLVSMEQVVLSGGTMMSFGVQLGWLVPIALVWRMQSRD